MGLLARRLAALAARVPELDGAVAPSTPVAAASLRRDGPDTGVFRRDDRSWTLVYDGTTVRVKDAKGIQFIARLLHHPGREIHALDLVADRDDGGSSTAPALQHVLGDAGEVLDRKARSAYRQRLDDLRARLDAAKEAGAVESATHLEDEIDCLARELSRAVGLGNRERRAGSAAERARLNVTRAIKAAEDTIAELHPSLGAYLRSTIRTGTFCVHTPDDTRPVSWRF
jgi:hypothetical protein